MDAGVAKGHVSHSTRAGAASIISRALTLNKTELITAVAQAQDHPSERSRERVILATCKLVHSIARAQYMSWASLLPASVDYCYIYGAGLEGLLRAMAKYDRTRPGPTDEPIAFTTYSTLWITQAVQRCIYSQCTHMKVGWELIRTRGAGIELGLAVSEHGLDRGPADGEVSESMAGNFTVRGREFGEEVADEHGGLGHQQVEDAMMVDHWIDRIDELELSPEQAQRRKQVLRLASEDCTLEEIAAQMPFSSQRVSRILGQVGHELEMIDQAGRELAGCS